MESFLSVYLRNALLSLKILIIIYSTIRVKHLLFQKVVNIVSGLVQFLLFVNQLNLSVYLLCLLLCY